MSSSRSDYGSLLDPTAHGGSHDSSSEAHEGDETTHNKLGTINGVFVPCCLNILGVVVFLRLSWATGQAGVLGVSGMLAVAELQAVLTVLSVAAMVSNGNMKGGGSYFMMSRSLGPELGGAMGILFYVAFAVGVSFYTIGFATEVKDTFFAHHETHWTIVIISSLALFLVLLVSYMGAAFFTGINVPLFIVQFATIFIAIFAMWFQTDSKDLKNGGEYHPPSIHSFDDVLLPDFTDDDQCKGKCSYHIIFGIIFPAATGIMEGANLSGDLAQPSKSIGKGTLMAVGLSVLCYYLLIVSFGFVFPRATMVKNTIALQDTCWSEYVVILGVMVCTLSSALGAVFGGSRVLQALAADDIIPGISFFAKGTKKGNEPRRAVIFTWFVAQCCIFIGDLDAISPMISSFFCLSYAMTNLACFLLE